MQLIVTINSVAGKCNKCSFIEIFNDEYAQCILFKEPLENVDKEWTSWKICGSCAKVQMNANNW